MAANTQPIFTKKGKIPVGNTAVVNANTAVDGTGTVQTIFTADATNGSYVDFIKFKPAASAANTTATTARLFINNGSDATVATNNQFYDSFVLPQTNDSITAASAPVIWPVKLMLPPGYKLNWVIATASANGWYATAVGGDY